MVVLLISQTELHETNNKDFDPSEDCRMQRELFWKDVAIGGQGRAFQVVRIVDGIWGILRAIMCQCS